MEKSFNTIEELRAEILVLNATRFQQENAIKERFNGPGAVLKTIGSLFKTDGKKSLLEDLLSQDIVTNISRVLLPVLLNNSLFRKSGFITKTLVTLFSQKAAKNVDMDFLSGAIEKIKGIFNKKHSKTAPDYGIPPDSETY